jgi:hypothetical protein
MRNNQKRRGTVGQDKENLDRIRKEQFDRIMNS